MTVTDTLERVCLLAEPLVEAATDDPTAATPNSEFDAATLVSHMICALDGATAMITGQEMIDDASNPPAREGDLPAAFRTAVDSTLDAFRQPGSLDRLVVGPGGVEMTGEMLLHFPLFDTYVHSWDLAQATGEEVDFPDDLTASVRGWAEQVFADGRPPVVGDPVEPLAGATDMDQLAAFTGRLPLRRMSSQVVHFEIRSTDPDASRQFYRAMFDWEYSEGQFERHTYIDNAGAHGGIRAVADEGPLVTVYAQVADVRSALDRAVELGGAVVQPATELTNVTIGLFADQQGNVLGVASPRT